jgi:hypothetical protein
MRVYQGTFLKKDKSKREMTFCRIKDIPSEFISSKITGEGTPRKYPEGMEIVWDIEASDFRVFNWKTSIGEIEEFDAEMSNFLV